MHPDVTMTIDGWSQHDRAFAPPDFDFRRPQSTRGLFQAGKTLYLHIAVPKIHHVASHPRL
jgi:hypothetical protein